MNRKLRYNDGWPWWMKHAGHLRRAFIGATKGSSIILVYHRVANDKEDPHGLAISPSVFEEHIESFSEEFQITPLPEVVACLREGRALPKRSLCITFDDGYMDNFTNALSMLERFHAPATFFVAGAGLRDPSYQYEWELQEPGVHRHVDAETLAAASAKPGVSIGGHTQTHPHLAQLSAEEQYCEIAENKELLQEILGVPVSLFAYPFGGPADFNAASVQAVHACGYQASVTTSSGLITGGIDRYRLPREDVSHLSAEDATAFIKHAFGG